MPITIAGTDLIPVIDGVEQQVTIAGVDIHVPTVGLQLSDWVPPAGETAIEETLALFQASAGAGTGGYAKGLWERPHTNPAATGFGRLLDGTFQFTFGTFTDNFDDIKFRDDGTNSRMAVARYTSSVENNGHISNWIQQATGPNAFVIQTANRTMRLPTSTTTDRSQGASWISWWIHGSSSANAFLTADDITELNRVRDNGDRFIAAFVR